MSERVDDELEVEQRGAEALADPDAFGALLDEVVGNALASEDERGVYRAPVPINRHWHVGFDESPPGDSQTVTHWGSWSEAFGTLRSLIQARPGGELVSGAWSQSINALLLWAIKTEPARAMDEWAPYLRRASVTLELDAVEQFARLAPLGLPVRLDLRRAWFSVSDDDALAPLCTPLARSLHALHTGQHTFDDAIARVLANEHLEHLTHLDVAYAPGPSTLEALDHPRLGNLRVLELDGPRDETANAYMLALLQRPVMRNVRRLNLRCATITPEVVASLAQWALGAPERHIDLTCWESLRDALLARAPRALALTQTPLALEALAQICALDHLRALVRLALFESELTDAHAALLADASNLAMLERLDLRFNHISDAGAGSLATSPHLQHITCLDLRHNPLSPRGVALLEARFGDRVRC